MTVKVKKLQVACEFGGVSLGGDGAARIGIKVSRDDMTLEQADKYLCGKRLSGKITATTGDNPAQKTIASDIDEQLEATFDVKRISATPTEIGASLTLVLDDQDVSAFAHFAKKKGWPIVDRVEVIEGEATADVNDEE